MDTILIKNARFYGYHGVFQEEQSLGQIFTVQLAVGLDLTQASLSDNLEDTLHYGDLYACLQELVENKNKRYQLLEGLAGAICQEIFALFAAARTIRIEITKENPPIAGHYDAVGVVLERQRWQ